MEYRFGEPERLAQGVVERVGVERDVAGSGIEGQLSEDDFSGEVVQIDPNVGERRRREESIARKAAELDERESALRLKIETFRARSEKVLSQIREQKDEVRQMIAEQLR